MPRPLPSYSPLRAKQALFDNWGLSDDSEDDKTTVPTITTATTPGVGSSHGQSGAVKKEDDGDGDGDGDYTKPRLGDAEIKHRRKSKAFTAAAKATLEEGEKKAREKQAKRERKESRRRQLEEQGKREQEREQERVKVKSEQEKRQKEYEQRPAKKRVLPGSAEVIDLTLPKVTPIPPPQVPPPPHRRAQSALEFVRTSAMLRRTSSNPLPESQNKKRKHTAETAASSFGAQSTHSTHGRSSAGGPASSGSTRRGDIFAGLSFYYLPDAALGARKLRIAKAQQHGATWVRSLDEATHVIVDKPFKWAEIESAVQGRRPEAIVVYDEYPLDCIGFRCLLNPTQRRYQIAGRPGPEAETEEQKRDRERRRHEKGEEEETKEKEEGEEKADHAAYLIKPDKHTNRRFVAAGSSSRSREPEQMIRQPRNGG